MTLLLQNGTTLYKLERSCLTITTKISQHNNSKHGKAKKARYVSELL